MEIGDTPVNDNSSLENRLCSEVFCSFALRSTELTLLAVLLNEILALS